MKTYFDPTRMPHCGPKAVVILSFLRNPQAVLLLAACRNAKSDRLLAFPGGLLEAFHLGERTRRIVAGEPKQTSG